MVVSASRADLVRPLSRRLDVKLTRCNTDKSVKHQIVNGRYHEVDGAEAMVKYLNVIADTTGL